MIQRGCDKVSRSKNKKNKLRKLRVKQKQAQNTKPANKKIDLTKHTSVEDNLQSAGKHKFHFNYKKFAYWVAGILTAFAMITFVINSMYSKPIAIDAIRRQIGATAFQEVGKTDSNHIAYTGNKHGNAYVWLVNTSNRKISKPEPINPAEIAQQNPNKIGYLTQVQLYHNLKNYKIHKNVVIYKGKKYYIHYGTFGTANADRLVPVDLTKKNVKKSKKIQIRLDEQIDKQSIRLKPVNLYVTIKEAQQNIKKRYHFDTKEITIINVTAESNGDINYYVIAESKGHLRPYKITVKSDTEVDVAVGKDQPMTVK